MEAFSRMLPWLRGDLSTEERVWGALLPILVIGGYFVGGLLCYVVRTALFGRYVDAEIEDRGHSAMLGRWSRSYFAWLMQPIWNLIYGLGIPPNALTTLSLLLSGTSAVALAAGRFSLGGWLYICAGSCDFFDGRLARRTGRATKAGAALDSILDRYGECAVLVGLAWFYRDSWVLFAVLSTLVGSFMISYVRARGEGLGVDVKVGMLQRPERLTLLGGALALSPILEAWLDPSEAHPLHAAAVVALVVLAVGTQVTALRRMFYLLGELEEKPRLSVFSAERGSLLRNVVAAALATLGDFAFVVLLVDRAALAPELATACGCVVGGILNFSINRLWTFHANGRTASQALRYAFVSGTSAALNAAGVAVLLFLPDIPYQLAWILARCAVFIGWSFPLHKGYVFADERAAARLGAPPAPTSPAP